MKGMMTMTATMTIEEIKNAEWEIHTNVTDGNMPQSMEDSQLVYKAYVATINGHEVKFEYTDEQGNAMYVDGERVNEDDVFEDDEDYGDYTNAMEVVGEMLDDQYDDLDEIHLECKWEMADPVFEELDGYGEKHRDQIPEVREFTDIDGEKHYIAYLDEEYMDDFDYEKVLDYHKACIREHVERHVYDTIEDYKRTKKFVGTDEQVQKIIDEEVASEIEQYVGTYSLQYYYANSEDPWECDQTHGVYMEGSCMDDQIEDLFVENDEQDEEE